jgi:hypothetical protein
MQPVVTSVVSFHRTAVITPLTVQLRVSIALHKLNCVQSISWYCMSLTYHIPIYIQTSCSYSKHTCRSECCRFSLVKAMQQHFQVMCFYILGFCHLCYQGKTVSGTGWPLLKDLKLPYNIGKKYIKNSNIYLAYFKTIKFEYTDKPHSAEHFQTLTHIMWIPSNWILDYWTWDILTFETFESTKTW